MMTAVGHLAKHGYVQVLRTAKGGENVLLAPEVLNNLAASFVLAARGDAKGLGTLDERRVLAGEYEFPELAELEAEDQALLLNAATLLFLDHNVCFRETPEQTTYMVFPQLINLRKPFLEDDTPTEEGASYTVSGAVENVYASLVVQLGHTSQFARTDQWKNEAQYHQARYEFRPGEVCGFRQTDEREGEIDLVLYYATALPEHTRKIFQGLFERFLSGRQVTVTRYPAQLCPKCGYRQQRTEVIRRTRDERGFIRCSECGKKIKLPKAGEPVALAPAERRLVAEQQATAELRKNFEKALFQIKEYVQVKEYAGREEPLSCFVSYAWGQTQRDKVHMRWVTEQLAMDLKNAGIGVILDRWHNAAVGASIPRFVSRIEKAEAVVVVGTPLYREKYENKVSETGSVVAAEVDLINLRLLGTEQQKETVYPVLLDGAEGKSLPPLMRVAGAGLC